MKTNKLDSLMEELSCEPRSPDYDSVLSSILNIDSKAREIAKGYGVPVEQIYKAIDFYPKGFVSEFGSNPEGSDFAYSDVMRDLQVLEKQIVPEPHKQYGGIRMPEFMRNDDALFGLFEKPRTTEGEAVKREDIVLKEKMGFFDKVAKFAGDHPYLSAGVLLGSLFGIGFAANAYQNNKKAVDNYVKSGIEKAKAEISAAASGFFFGGASAPIDKTVPANATVKATPQVSETPQLDYYDPDFNVGIVIEGDAMFKQNVSNMLNTMKDVTPKRYAEVIPYAPKKIVKSRDRFNWYGGIPPNDEIKLSKIAEEEGGSDNIKTRLFGTSNLYAEMRNALRIKTNTEIHPTAYENIMEDSKGLSSFLVETGVWTQKQENEYLKYVSEQLKEGRFFDGAKLNQS